MAAGQVHRASLEHPFHASIGATPPLPVGREDSVEDFADALDEPPWVLERISLFTGARGVGKSCVLNSVEDEARTRSWHVFSQSADLGFMVALSRQVAQAIERFWAGTLITLDEVYATNVAELRSFATAIQNPVRADVAIAVATVDIPSVVETRVDDRDGDDTVTFIRWVDRISMGRVSDGEVFRALWESVGSSWEDATSTWLPRHAAGIRS